MSKIVITEADHRELAMLLDSEFAKVAGPAPHLDDLNRELARAEIVGPGEVPTNVVTMNSKIVLRDLDTGEREVYSLVFPYSADIAEGRLSVLAPIGTAILGERVGEELRWRVPSGLRRLRIEEVIYQPEREGATR